MYVLIYVYEPEAKVGLGGQRGSEAGVGAKGQKPGEAMRGKRWQSRYVKLKKKQENAIRKFDFFLMRNANKCRRAIEILRVPESPLRKYSDFPIRRQLISCQFSETQVN